MIQKWAKNPFFNLRFPSFLSFDRRLKVYKLYIYWNRSTYLCIVKCRKSYLDFGFCPTYTKLIWYYITVHKTPKNVLLILHVYLVYTVIWYFRVGVIMSLILKIMWPFFIPRHQNRKVWRFHLQDEYVNFVWLLSCLVFVARFSSFVCLAKNWKQTSSTYLKHPIL